jgi:hypothetical protein
VALGAHVYIESKKEDLAAKALDIIEADVEKLWNDAERRSAWSLFLMSLMMRMPEDLAALTQIAEDKWKRDLPSLREKYAANRLPDHPETIEEFIEKEDPEFIGRWVMDDLPELTQHERMGQTLNAMRWSAVVKPDDAPPFLTSDRPLFMSKTFSEPECYLTLPIGPHRLFVATNTEAMERKFKDWVPKELAQEVNSQVRQTGREVRLRGRPFGVGFRRQADIYRPSAEAHGEVARPAKAEGRAGLMTALDRLEIDRV